MWNRVCLVLLLLFVAVIANNFSEDFQSYAYPWKNYNYWDWNWWRRWYQPRWYNKYRWRRWWRPRCPAGCRWVGGDKGYGCPVPSLAYGNFACKYDFECKNCDWGYDGYR